MSSEVGNDGGQKSDGGGDGDVRLWIGVSTSLVEGGGIGSTEADGRIGVAKGINKSVGKAVVLSQDLINSFQVIVVCVS